MSKNCFALISFVLVLGLMSNASADLVGHWTLDDGSGTTAIDISGNGNDGTLMDNPDLENPTWIPGIRGEPWTFMARAQPLPAETTSIAAMTPAWISLVRPPSPSG